MTTPNNNMPAPTATVLALTGHISRISRELGKDNSLRFVISIMVAGNPPKYHYFSTPLGSPESVRINTQQLRNAFPELMGITIDDDVFLKLLTSRSKFVGREVHFTVSDQLDRETQRPVINPKTNTPYTNVRLEASSEDLSEEDARKLLNGSDIMAAAPTATTAEQVDDLPM